MSGVASAAIVGVKRWSSPGVHAIGSASGNSSSFRNASAGSPITTISFGPTMCSSWTRNGRASSVSSPTNLRQFVP